MSLSDELQKDIVKLRTAVSACSGRAIGILSNP